MPRDLAPLALLALAACGPAAVRPPPSAVEITLAPSDAPPAAPPTAEPAPPPKSDAEVLAPPSPIGCEIAGKRLFSPFDEALPLCLAAAGPCFARSVVASQPVRITATFGEGDARAAGVVGELDDGKIAVRGALAPEHVKLYPRLVFTIGSPTAAGDFVVPVGRALEIERAARGRVEVALALGRDVSLPGGVVRAERRCDELSIEGSGFGRDEVRRFVAGKPAAAGPKHELPLDKDTPLSTAPGLPPVAVLHPRDELDVEIDVLERRGRAARVFWVRSGFAVYGWVPAAALKRSTIAGVFGMMGGVPGGLPPRVSGQPFACNADLRLIVELAGRRVDVGKIRKGTRFLAGARRDGFVAVDLLDGPVERTGVAEWRVREAEFTSACAPAS